MSLKNIPMFQNKISENQNIRNYLKHAFDSYLQYCSKQKGFCSTLHLYIFRCMFLLWFPKFLANPQSTVLSLRVNLQDVSDASPSGYLSNSPGIWGAEKLSFRMYQVRIHRVTCLTSLGYGGAEVLSFRM